MVRRLRMRATSATPDVVRIVVGVDFDEPSLATARWLARYCAAGTELVLVHVLPIPRAPAFLHGQLRSSEHFVSQVAPAMRGGLEGLASSFGTPRLPVRVEVRVGEPAEQLAAVAEEVNATLVCVGHARSRQDGARSGRNTVDRLARRLSIPLLQGAPEARRPARILVAVDGGPQSDAILATAWELAERLGARLDALHVLDEDVRAYARAMAMATGDAAGAATAERALARAASDWIQDRLIAVGAPATPQHAWVRSGTPASALLAAVADGDLAHPDTIPGGKTEDGDGEDAIPDMIVLGREGRDALRSGLLGGTTRRLLQAAAVPVMVVPVNAPPAPTPDDRGRKRSRQHWTLGARPTGETLALVDAGGDGDDGGLPPAARLHEDQPKDVASRATSVTVVASGRPA